MLNMYQLWLDDLYPRAKFADALAIIEKVGHTKRMQVDRKAWIDEGKPRHTTEQDEDGLDLPVPGGAAPQDPAQTKEGLEEGENATRAQLDSDAPLQHQVSAQLTAEEPDEDELDALLADSERAAHPAARTLPAQRRPTDDDPFADEMEAMEGMEDMW